jgi:multiple sugar transport system permease protein
MTTRMKVSSAARGLGIVVLVALAGFPVYWLFTTATHTTAELFGGHVQLLPDLGQVFSSFNDAASGVPMFRWLSNSAVVAFGTTALSLVIAILAAYALSRYRFRGKGLFGFALFATQMLPEALLVVPLYAMFLTFGLLDHLGGLVLSDTAFSMPVAVWILKSAMDGVPLEIEESARVDGCPRYAMLTQIMLPLITPSIAAAAVITFFDGWNEYLFANTFITDEQKWPAAKGLASFIGEFVTPLNFVMAAALMFTLPAIVFFLFVQRRIVSGLTAGSVKG